MPDEPAPAYIDADGDTCYRLTRGQLLRYGMVVPKDIRKGAYIRYRGAWIILED